MTDTTLKFRSPKLQEVFAPDGQITDEDVILGKATQLAQRRNRLGIDVNVHELPERHVWQNAKRRTSDPSRKEWAAYGGRGIRMCDRWMESFDHFYADMGPRPGPEYSLDRIDPNGPYSPENCRWTTWDIQQKNRRQINGEAYNALQDQVSRLEGEILALKEMISSLLNGNRPKTDHSA